MHYVRKVFSFFDAISKVTGIASAIIMGMIAFMVFYEVVMRYVFRNPTGWTIDFVPFLMLWGGFIGASLTLREDKHIRVDLLIRHLSPKTRKLMQVVTGSLGILFCLILFIKGIEMVIHTNQIGAVTPGSVKIPVFIPQLCVPIGALLLLLQFVKRLGNDLVSLSSSKIEIQE